MNRVVAASLRHRGAVALAAAMLVAAALPGLFRLEIDNSPASFFLDGSARRASYERFEAAFGSGSALRLVVAGERLLDAPGLAFVERLERESAATPRVLAVASPLAHLRRLHPGASAAELAALDRATLRSELAADPLTAKLALVRLAPDGGDTGDTGDALSLLLAVEPDGGARRRELVDALAALAAAAPAGVEARLAGLPALDHALDGAARSVLTELVPLLALVSFLLLFATFRELRPLVAPAAFVLFVGVVVFGAMGHAGVKLDLVIAVLPPVLLSIALAQAVHLLLRGRDVAATAESAEGGPPEGAVLATYREKGRAIGWTTLSTIAGFGSLCATPVAPIVTLGLWGALAMLAIGVTSFVFYPPLLAIAIAPGPRRRAAHEDIPERELELRLERFGRRVAGWAVAHRVPLLAGYAATALLAAAGILRLEVESNALDYFAPASELRQSFAFAEERGMPLATVELLGEAKPGTPFATAAALDELARLTAELERIPGVAAAVAPTTLLDSTAAMAAATPLARAFDESELRARLLPLVRADAAGGPALASLLTADDRTARISLFVPLGGYEAIDPILERAEAAARRFAPGAVWHATGVLPLLLETQHRLLDTLVLSLAWAVPAIAIVFLLLLRSVPRALLALVPNAWPVLAILGGMGWLGVPIDVATVMVASIVAGLVVEDTIHTLAPYRDLERRLGAAAAVAERLEKTAPAFVLTSAVLASGFAVCSLSSFLPVSRFGILSVVAIAIALAADLLLVPALFGGGAKRP